MKSAFTLLKFQKDSKKAVAPMKGAAVFSCSTGTTGLSNKKCFPAISQRKTENRSGSNNLLPETHYFRRERAEGPKPNVVLTEGQKNSLGLLREVAA